jgi:hypothetical protein
VTLAAAAPETAEALDAHDLRRAEVELLLALDPGPESSSDLRLADWAKWWGPRLLWWRR